MTVLKPVCLGKKRGISGEFLLVFPKILQFSKIFCTSTNSFHVLIVWLHKWFINMIDKKLLHTLIAKRSLVKGLLMRFLRFVASLKKKVSYKYSTVKRTFLKVHLKSLKIFSQKLKKKSGMRLKTTILN